MKKNEKLKLEKFRVLKLNNPSSVNGGDGDGQGDTVIKTIINPNPTLITRPTMVD
mgnify:CR=1 FL=1